MEADLAQAVRDRAGGACEYCRMPQAAFPATRFHVDHITAKQYGGRTELANLALSCFNCNAFKGPNIAGNDPKTGRLARIFNPRRQRWSRHFRWNGARLVGRTLVGRVTAYVLNMNDEEVVLIRAAMIEEGLLVPET